MPFKILFFANTSFIGGAERNILDLANKLNEKGHDISIASLERGGPLLKMAKINGIRTFDPDFKYYFSLSYIKNIYSFLKLNNFDFIFIYGLKLKVILIPLAFYHRKLVIISMILGLDVWKKNVRIIVEKILIPFTSFWISNSIAAKENSIRREGTPQDLIYVIYNGLPINCGIKNKTKKKEKRKDFKIITLANIQKNKGHYFFLKVIKKVIEIDPNITFNFIGKDFTNGEIQKEIKRFQLENNVSLSGFIFDVRSYIHNYDLMVLPSFSESLPTSIIECMLEGVPVLATRVGGIPEIIKNEKTGWLVEAGDEESFIKKIITIKYNEKKRNEISNNAYLYAINKFNIDKISTDYERLLQLYIPKKDASKNKFRIMRVQSRIVVGGPALHTILLSRALNNDRFQTVLVGGANKSSEKSLVKAARNQNIRCFIIPEMAREIHFYDDIISFIKLYRLIKRVKPDIFHSHTSKGGAIGRLAAYLAGVPIIFHTFHGHIFEGYFGRTKSIVFIWLEKLLARISTNIIVISESQKKDIVKKYRINSNHKTKLIPLGFEWSGFFHEDKNVNFRKQFNLPENKFLIGSIGRIVPIKDHALFIKIAHQLIQKHPSKFHFVIIGDGELREEMETDLELKGIRNYFTFTGWWNTNVNIYQNLDLLLLTSQNEGTPVAVIEALASGTPVIASAVGGVLDVMSKYCREFAVADRDPAKYVVMIEKLYNSRVTVPAETSRFIRNYYSSERLIRDMKELYLQRINDS